MTHAFIDFASDRLQETIEGVEIGEGIAEARYADFVAIGIST